jgi:REP element-mobilizing transposase RayT
LLLHCSTARIPAVVCGEDSYTGQSYEHRRDWFIERLATLNEIFTIDVCAYEVMSNHCHLVLYVNLDVQRKPSMDEVINRWCTL